MHTTFAVKTRARNQLVDITGQLQTALRELGAQDGIATIYCPHTTAGITINENADPDVVRDILYGLGEMVPERGYHHGEGNSPAHIKSSLIGCSETVLVENGQLVLGTWQGIYFCEFDGPRSRRVTVTLVTVT